MDEKSPFGKASVMSGYPLDQKEKDAVKKTLKASKSSGYSLVGSKGSSNGKFLSRQRKRAKG